MHKFIEKLLSDRNVRAESLKSVAVGTLCTLLDILLMALFLYFGNRSNYAGFFDVFKTINSVKSGGDQTLLVMAATLAAFLVSFLVNYALSVFFVYTYGNIGRNKKGFFKFLIFAAVALVINTLGQLLGYNVLGINLWVVKIVLIVVLFVFNFITRKYYIFNIQLIIDEENTIIL